jgi:hypothetical protein
MDQAIRVERVLWPMDRLYPVELLSGRKRNHILAAARGYQLHPLYEQYGSSSILHSGVDAMDRVILVKEDLLPMDSQELVD